MTAVTVGGVCLEVARLPSARPRRGAPAVVFLHEALGSATLWRDFPRRVADATGCEAIAYSRAGHGWSDPAPRPRTPRYLHDEGLLVLPALLAALGVARPVLLGHSDGATIALVCAGGTTTPLAGVVVEAPHVMVEEVTLAGIRRTVASAQATGLERRLARHHSEANAAPVYCAWHETWLAPEFRSWSIEELLPGIACPVLAIQGEDDEYASMAHLDRIAALAADVEQLRIRGCGHSPHRDVPHLVIEAVAAFIGRLRTGA